MEIVKSMQSHYFFVFNFVCDVIHVFSAIYVYIINTNPETENTSLCRCLFVYINIYVERHGPRVATSPLFFCFALPWRQYHSPDKHFFLKKGETQNKYKVHVVIGLRMEIVKSMQSHFFFFFNFVCDVILFENEVYILINSVTRFDDTMGTVHLSSFEACLVSTNVIEDI